jgi:tetratricopeptide (TPR) repeat protein
MFTILRARWLAVFLAALLVVVLGHAWIMSGQSARASKLARPDVQITLPYQQIRPEFTVDGHMWIRYAVRLLEGEGPQLRTTDVDNAPHGREVHWNSGYAWWLALGGWGWHHATGLPLTSATERAAMWINAPLLIGFSLLFAIWAARRAGVVSGWIVGSALVVSPVLYEGFWPGYADHHGITLAAILGLVLGGFWMRGGWLSGADPTAEARAISAARGAGFWGGVAMWISAASAIPAIGLVAVSAVVATLLTRRKLAASDEFYPSVWRAWGRTGALTSLGFYLLEYFPAHLGWRLEVNHPLYALAWLAGAELVCRVMPILVHGGRGGAWKQLGVTASWALPVALAPAVAVIIWQSRVFLPVDPFMAGLHKTIVEFLPQLFRLGQDGLLPHLHTLVIAPIIYLLGLAGWWVRGVDRWALGFALSMALPLHALGFYQSRWAMSAAPGQVLILVVVFAALPKIPGLMRGRWRLPAASAAIAVIVFGPAVYLRARDAYTYATVEGITAGDARQLLYREVAQVIRESQPQGDVVLFGSPNTSVNVAFFGDFKSLGTLYWENLDGLKAAAEISAARTEEEAARLIKARGVTHLAFFRDGNYILEYAILLNDGSTVEEAQQTFGYRLLGARVVPVWLEALPYAAPTGLPEDVDREVLVFKVNFAQQPDEAAYKLAALQARRGEVADALNTFALALQFNPGNFPAALRRGELFVTRKEWDAAQQCFDQAVAIAPPTETYRLLTQVGIGFDTVGETARAVLNYERAMQATVTNTVAPNNLAWILATAKDPALRNPARALELAQRCVALQPESPPLLGTLAAAQAAAGKFVEASATLEQAMRLARQQGAVGMLPQMEERAAAYRGGRLWLP